MTPSWPLADEEATLLLVPSRKKSQLKRRPGSQDSHRSAPLPRTGNKARFDKVRSLLKSHVVQNLYRGKDVAIILSSMTDAVLAEPQELSTADEASKLKVKLWNMEVEEYVLQKGQLEENKVILHTIIWEQCTKSLRIKLKETDG